MRKTILILLITIVICCVFVSCNKEAKINTEDKMSILLESQDYVGTVDVKTFGITTYTVAVTVKSDGTYSAIASRESTKTPGTIVETGIEEGCIDFYKTGEVVMTPSGGDSITDDMSFKTNDNGEITEVVLSIYVENNFITKKPARVLVTLKMA